MENRNTRRGFTLIELLVVVLIIGILAAVALPQYQMLPEKMRAVEAITTLHQVAAAEHFHVVSTGNYTSDFSELELLSFPGASGRLYSTKYWSYNINNARPSASFFASRRVSNAYIFLTYYLEHRPWLEEDFIVCMAQGTDTLAARICGKLGVQTKRAIDRCVTGNVCYEVK